MDHTLLVLLLCFWSSGVHGGEIHSLQESFRLVRGSSRCDGFLELKLEEWRRVTIEDFKRRWRIAAFICRKLDCGSAIDFSTYVSTYSTAWEMSPECILSGSALKDCAKAKDSAYYMRLTCSEQTVEPDRTTEGNLPPKEPTAEPDRTTEGNLHLRVFTPVFIFCLVLMVLSVTFFISAVWFTYKPTRGQKSETEKDRELKTQQQSLNSPDGDVEASP